VQQRQVITDELRIEFDRDRVVSAMKYPFVRAVMGTNGEQVEPRKLNIILWHPLPFEIFGRAKSAALGGAELCCEQPRVRERPDHQCNVEAVAKQPDAVVAKDADQAKVGVLFKECCKQRADKIVSENIGNCDPDDALRIAMQGLKRALAVAQHAEASQAIFEEERAVLSD